MGHYDFRYEVFTGEEVNEKLEQVTKLLARYKQEHVALTDDLGLVIHTYTKEVLNEKAEDVARSIKKTEKEFTNWLTIKQNIEQGKTYTWAQAHAVAGSAF